VNESVEPRPLYSHGPWIWWHRAVACFVAAFTVFSLGVTSLVWELSLAEPTRPNIKSMVLAVLMSATLLLLSFLTLLRGRERVSWMTLLPGDALRVRTLNGTLKTLPASQVGKRKFEKAGVDSHTGFSSDETRLLLPIQSGGVLYLDLVDGLILDEANFQRLFRWSRERPPVGGGKRPNRHKKNRAA
jgi:hypothetical protein